MPDRQICRKPDTGQSVHISTSVAFGPVPTMDDEIVVLWWWWYRRQNIRRKYWVHPILRERFTLGTFETLI